mmetsp:Transcript_21455/g.53193  ORF Transcript_21455/g.53193 Transcript_21455/m.53193 type:complete len:244 (+) Transcript_21455:489-1220(+)
MSGFASASRQKMRCSRMTLASLMASSSSWSMGTLRDFKNFLRRLRASSVSLARPVTLVGAMMASEDPPTVPLAGNNVAVAPIMLASFWAEKNVAVPFRSMEGIIPLQAVSSSSKMTGWFILLEAATFSSYLARDFRTVEKVPSQARTVDAATSVPSLNLSKTLPSSRQAGSTDTREVLLRIKLLVEYPSLDPNLSTPFLKEERTACQLVDRIPVRNNLRRGRTKNRSIIVRGTGTNGFPEKFL